MNILIKYPHQAPLLSLIRLDILITTHAYKFIILQQLVKIYNINMTTIVFCYICIYTCSILDIFYLGKTIQTKIYCFKKS